MTREEDAAILAAGLTPHTERWTGESRLRKVARRLGQTEVGWPVTAQPAHTQRRPVDHQGFWTEAEDNVIHATAHQKKPGWVRLAADIGPNPRSVHDPRL